MTDAFDWTFIDLSKTTNTEFSNYMSGYSSNPDFGKDMCGYPLIGGQKQNKNLERITI